MISLKLLVSFVSLSQAFALQPLSQFVGAGRRHALANKQAGVDIAQQDANQDSSFYKLLPTAFASLSYAYNPIEGKVQLADPNGALTTITTTPHNQFDAILSVNVPIFDLHALYRYRASKHESSRARYEARAAAQAVDAMVADWYFKAFGVGAMLATAQKRLEIAQQIGALAKARVAADALPAIEVRRTDVEIGSAKSAIKQLEIKRGSAQRMLVSLTGLKAEPSSSVMLPDSLAEEEPIDTWLAAIDSLPSVEGAAKGVEAADANVAAVNSEWFPTINATASDRLTNAGGFQQSPNIWSVGVTATWKFDFGTTSAQKSAKATRASAKLKLLEAKEDARNAISAAHEQLQIQASSYGLTRDQANFARENLADARTKYEAATVLTEQVLSLTQQAFVAELAEIQAFADYNYARALLRIASGKDLSGGKF